MLDLFNLYQSKYVMKDQIHIRPIAS